VCARVVRIQRYDKRYSALERLAATRNRTSSPLSIQAHTYNYLRRIVQFRGTLLVSETCSETKDPLSRNLPNVGERKSGMIGFKRISKFLAALPPALLLASSNAVAWPGCVSIFATTYPDSQTEDRGSCQTCHQSSGGGGNFNPFGQDLLDNGANGADGSCSNVDLAAALVAVEELDSDMEGNSNIIEIQASAQPGWCDATQSASCNNSAGAPNVLLDPAPPAPSNNRPTADAGGPYSGEAGNTSIQFDSSASTDPDGDALTYAWDFGDQSSATGAAPRHVYATAGNFRVTLVVSDGQVDSDPAVSSAAITAPPMNVAPIADPGGPYDGQPGQPVPLDGSASSDPNDDTLTYSWDFGDGSFGSGASPTHTFDAEGTYTIMLTVNDGQAESAPAATSATIATPPANRAPAADAGGPYTGETGLLVSFDGTSSSDPDGDALTYLWDLGDGTTADGATPTHGYRVAGTYTIRLVVNDGEFDSESAMSSATISDPALQSDGQALYETNCLACHGDPWADPAVDDALPGLRRVAGARTCNIEGSIFGTSVFPNGVPDMQHLQGLSNADIEWLAEYLNSSEINGEQRYVTTCAGCHGDNGAGGRVDEDVHGDSAGETLEAIADEEEMHYLACMPRSDIDVIANFLTGFDDDNDDDGIDDDEDSDDDNDGINDDDDSDDDNDGVSDDDEREDGTDPRDHDSDDDGLDDGDERDRGTDPQDEDSDDDGVSDGDEVNVFGTNPLLAESPATASESVSGGGSMNTLLLALLAVAVLLGRRRAFKV
jgi:PKD repeat protein